MVALSPIQKVKPISGQKSVKDRFYGAVFT